MEKQLTVKEVLEDVRKILGDINVPVSKIEEIGFPISKAIKGITICLDAFNNSTEKQAEQEEELEPAEPRIEIVPAEENEDNA